MISMENVSAGYGKCEVLHKVSLEISGEGITTLIGANGCGKSTLLRVLLGFLPLWDGDVRIDGISLKEMPGAELAKRVAYLPQGKDVPDISAERMVLHGRFPYLSYPRRYRKADYEIAEAAMEQMGILPFAGKQMSRLSGGMRQKVYIAMALAQQAGIIVMDEPTTYLDIGQQLPHARVPEYKDITVVLRGNQFLGSDTVGRKKTVEFFVLRIDVCTVCCLRLIFFSFAVVAVAGRNRAA